MCGPWNKRTPEQCATLLTYCPQFSLLRDLKLPSQYLLAILPAYFPCGTVQTKHNCHPTPILTPSFMPPPTNPLAHYLLLHPSKEKSLYVICPNPNLHPVLLAKCILSCQWLGLAISSFRKDSILLSILSPLAHSGMQLILHPLKSKE